MKFLLVATSLLAGTALAYGGDRLSATAETASVEMRAEREATSRMRAEVSEMQQELLRRKSSTTQFREKSRSMDEDVRELRATRHELIQLKRRLNLPAPGAEEKTLRALLIAGVGLSPSTQEQGGEGGLSAL